MNSVRMDLPVLLPEIPDAHDACVRRLESLLSKRRGILATHIVEEAGRSVMCLHYDADAITLDDVQRLARAAGAEITERYGHRVWPLRAIAGRGDRRVGQPPGPDCPRRVRSAVSAQDALSVRARPRPT